MSEGSSHTRILHNRYYHLLKCIPSIESLVDILYSNGILSTREKANILSGTMADDKRDVVCQVLIEKGISQYVEIIELLKNEQKRQSLEEEDPLASFEVINTPTSASVQEPTDVYTLQGNN